MNRAITGVGVALVLISQVARGQDPEVAPRFETDVDVVAVDASVVDGDGRPVRGLTAADFLVEVDGRRRRVLSADFIETGRVSRPDPDQAPPPVAQPVAAPPRHEGRRIILVIDTGEIGIGTVRQVTASAASLLDQLTPDDKVALFTIPSGPRLDFTADRGAVEAALAKIGPSQDRIPWEFSVTLVEAAKLVERRERIGGSIELRECVQYLKSERTTDEEACAARVLAQAHMQVEHNQRSVQDRLSALEALCQALAAVPGRKTMVLVSGGLGSEVLGAARSIAPQMKRIATAAAAARVSLYTLYASQRAVDVEAAQSRPSHTAELDREFIAAGLEKLTGLAGGAMFEVVVGGKGVFARVASEISGHYLLGLEPDKDDRDGKPHDIEVKVARKGVLVRARRQFVMDPASLPRRVRRTAPPAPPSPVRMTSHVLRGASDAQIKVLLAAEVEGFSEGRLAVQIVTPAGTVVGTLADELKMEDGPARWQDTLILARGPYVLKAEAVDAAGKRVTAESPLNAELLHGVGFDSSDLMLFERVGESTRLVAGSAVRGRVMPVYLELYVQEALPTDRLGVTIEIVGADGTRRGAAPLSLRKGGEPGLFFAEGQVDVWALPPGKYEARALVTFGTKVARRVERHFEVIR